MRIFLFIFCLFLYIQDAASQVAAAGKITNLATGEPIPFVNIGIVGTSAGAVSDKEGNFSFSVDERLADGVARFSVIGYKKKTYPLQEIAGRKNLVIEMEKVIYEIGELVVESEKLRQARVGSRASSNRIVTGWGYRPTGSERGVRIKTGNRPIHIESLHFHVARNELDYVLMRIHIRRMEGDVPGESLLTDDILVPVKQSEGWVKLDLDSWNLVFDEDIAVTLQPVSTRGTCKSQYCLSFSLGMFRFFSSNWLLAKDGSEGEWKVRKNYSPGIYLTVYR